MVSIHAGAQLERPPGPKYLDALRFAELALPAPLPRSASLRRWREKLPASFEIALVAPRPTRISPAGPMRMDADLEEAVEWLLEAADELRARALVFPTGAEITTGQRDRDRLATYFERIPKSDERPVVWAPTGLWEPEMAIPKAEAMGVIYGFDPLETAPPPGPWLYGRLRAVGGRQRFGEGMLYEVVDRLAASGSRDAYVAIESPRSFREATLLQRMADESTLEGDRE